MSSRVDQQIGEESTLHGAESSHPHALSSLGDPLSSCLPKAVFLEESGLLCPKLPRCISLLSVGWGGAVPRLDLLLRWLS